MLKDHTIYRYSKSGEFVVKLKSQDSKSMKRDQRRCTQAKRECTKHKKQSERTK